MLANVGGLNHIDEGQCNELLDQCSGRVKMRTPRVIN